MALGSTQPLTEMSTRLFPGGKGGRCVRLTTLPPSCAVVVRSGNLNFLEPSGPLQACNGTALSLLMRGRDLFLSEHRCEYLEFILLSVFPMVQQPPLGQGLSIIQASRSDTPHSVGLLWMSDRPDEENST